MALAPLVALLLALAPPAQAGHPSYGTYASPVAHRAPPARPSPARPGGIDVHNDRDRPVDVYVDGRYRGTVEAGARRILSAPAGMRAVDLRAGRRVLASHTLRLHPGRPVTLHLPPPQVALVLTNPGRHARFVRVGQSAHGTWIAPGASVTLHHAPGPVWVHTAVATRHGLTDEGAFTVVLHPRHGAQVSLMAPAPRGPRA